MSYAPGGRYVVVGTKEGDIEVCVDEKTDICVELISNTDFGHCKLREYFYVERGP
jgi:hypothetical protein